MNDALVFSGTNLLDQAYPLLRPPQFVFSRVVQEADPTNHLDELS